MIRNHTEYIITKNRIDMFKEALMNIDATTFNEDEAFFIELEKNAIKSQLDDLEKDVLYYEALTSGAVKMPKVIGFQDFTKALILSRIIRGLNEEQLARAVGITSEEIINYELTEYHNAEPELMLRIADELGVRVTDDLEATLRFGDVNDIYKKLGSVGITKEFIRNRLNPSHLSDNLPRKLTGSFVSLLGKLGKMFGEGFTNVLGEGQLVFSLPLDIKYKMPSNAAGTKVEVYTAYAYYLARLAKETSRHIPMKELPQKSEMVRDNILKGYGDLNYRNVLNYLWDLGVVVIPLNDTGAFHGAFWRIEGRNVIILKQGYQKVDRWLYDLLHEYFHASLEPELDQRSVVDYENNQVEKEEVQANIFAANVLLKGRANEIAQICVSEANGKVERLKGVVPKIAEAHGVPVGALANYLAFRLSVQNGINWWGAANNLQLNDGDPWAMTRDVFLRHSNLSVLEKDERETLIQALTR